jgi:hypothetical protein
MEAVLDLDSLLEANARFYRVLEELDLEEMEGLWMHEGWVRCLHPGWEPLTGWEAVRRSFEQIQAGTQWIRITPTAIAGAVYGPLGVVSCAENITASRADNVGVALAHATNLFVSQPAGWRMIHHHASSVPVEVTQGFSGILQ